LAQNIKHPIFYKLFATIIGSCAIALHPNNPVEPLAIQVGAESTKAQGAIRPLGHSLSTKANHYVQKTNRVRNSRGGLICWVC